VQSVRVTLRHEGDVLCATVVWFPATLVLRGRPLDDDAHLVVNTNEPSETALQLADVVLHEEAVDAPEWITRTLAALPGATVAARPVDDTAWLAGTSDEHQVRFDNAGALGPALASVALTWTAKGRPLCTLPERVDLIIGGVRHQAEATVTRCCC
jgi:hypothetical protein